MILNASHNVVAIANALISRVVMDRARKILTALQLIVVLKDFVLKLKYAWAKKRMGTIANLILSVLRRIVDLTVAYQNGWIYEG